MASFSTILSPFSLFLLILTISTQPHLSFSTSTTDIHELLPTYGFPIGLLPNNVKSYSLSDDGSFKIELLSPCYVKFSDLVYYARTIEGKLSYGFLSDVSGIQVKKLFVWLPITEIKADPASRSIEFVVGLLSEKYPASMFDAIPTCKSRSSLGERTEAM